MLSNSIMSQGLQGMQQSQSKMLQAAEDIVRAGTTSREQHLSQAGAVPASENGAAANDLTQAQTVPEGAEVESSNSLARKPNDLVGALVEQTRQQHIFDASASIVKVASETLGSLIDDLS